jgi:glycosyltransferase involved in cell wall biosynthesis
MNILIVCPRLCHGGAERVAACLANGFIEKGHTVRFMTNLFEEQTYKLDRRVRVVNLVSTTNSKIKKWFSAVKLVHKEVKKSRPDIVIGIMELCSFISKIATIGSGVPIVATEHNSFERPQSAPMSMFEKFFKFYVNKCFDHITVLTEADKNVIGKRLKSVVVMPNPLAIEPTNSVALKKNTIIAAGRVDNWYVKGFDVLIRAWGLIYRNITIDNGEWTMENGQIDVQSSKFNVQRSKLEGWVLQIAGVWRSDETIRYLTGLLPDGDWIVHEGKLISDKYHVEFLGFVDDMRLLYQQSSIFVLSSRYEGFGLVLIEAMSQGCACVACDYKGRQREIFEELKNEKVEELKSGSYELCKNGILCPPDDVEALATALAKMIEDVEYRLQTQKKAIERSNYYSLDNTMDRWEAYLDNIIKEQQK